MDYTVKYDSTIFAAKEAHSLLVEVANSDQKQQLGHNFLQECCKCSIQNCLLCLSLLSTRR